MMQSLAGLAIFTVGYGMATSLEAAMVFRFICGGFNGVAITAKTVLAEAVPQRLQVRLLTDALLCWSLVTFPTPPADLIPPPPSPP